LPNHGVSLNFRRAVGVGLFTFAVIAFTLRAQTTDPTNSALSILVVEQGDNRPTFLDFMPRLRQALTAKLSSHVVIYRENLDLAHFGEDGYRTGLENWLSNKYHGRKLDAIVASGGTSIDFILKARPKLWPQVPVIAIETKELETTLLAGQTNVSGIAIDTDVLGTLTAALQLCPDTRRIAFVSSTEINIPELQASDFKKAKDFSANRFEFIPMVGLTMDETKQRLATLPPNTIVFYDDIWMDASGQIFVPRDALEELSSVSRAPIFSYSDSYIGFGMTGGSCIANRTLATEAANHIAAVIRAGNASSVPDLQNVSRRLVFDWRQMRRHGLNEKNLPAGSEIRSRQSTVWESYHRMVIITAAILFVQSLLIAALLLQRRRKRLAETELFQSRQMLQTVLDTIPQRVFWKDHNSVYLGCNQPLADDCGFPSPGEIVGKTDFETIASAHANRYRADDREVMDTNRPKLGYEEQQNRKDGSTAWLRTNKVPLLDKDGRVIGVLGTYEDITLLKRAEEALRESGQRFRSLLDNAPDAVFVQTNQRIVYANQATLRLLRAARPEQLLGHPVVDFVAPEWREPVRQRMRQVNTTGGGPLPAMEEEYLCLDQSQVVVEVTAVPVVFQGEQGALVFARDITKNKLLEEQLRQSQKMEAFGQLAGGVAHDFNNLLTIIEGHVALLQLRDSTPAERASGLAEIAKAAERAANLTRQLLTFSRRQLFQPKPIDLNEVVTNTTKMLQRLIGEHIGLETHFAPGGAPVIADCNMMEQILINLAVNSRDAMPKGGRLIIQTSAINVDEADAADNPKARPGAFIRLTVTDTGCGIAPEEMERIFEPFFTTKEIGKGTGLGLATVFGIVTQHHGWIEVKSRPNEGATFHIHLPRLAESGTALAELSRLADVRGGSETILLVEDEAPVRSLTRTLLERKGYHILEAESGQSALEIWQQQRGTIDLLFTDMVMPAGLSGRELAAQLLAEKPALKVIYVSGYTDDMLGEGSPLRHNPNFLEKPFDSYRLLKRVRDCLDGVTET